MSRRPAVFQDGSIGKPIGEFIGAASNAINQRREEADIESRDRNARLNYDKDKAEDDARDKTIEGIKGGGHIGIVNPDLHNDNELYKLQQEAYKLAELKVPNAQLQAYIAQRLKPINDGYTALKAFDEQAKLQSKELATAYGGDATKAYEMIMKENQKDVFDFDEAGNIKGYKGIIVPSGDHAASLTSIDKLPEWVGSSDALVKHVSTLPKNSTTQNRIVRDKGFAHIDKNTEETTALFEEDYDAKGNLVGKKVKVDENGAMPPEQFEIFKQDPKAYAQFARLYKPTKEAEMKRFQEFGMLGEEGLSPEADDLMQRRLAAKITGSGISGLKSTSEIQDITPKPANVTNINNGKQDNGPMGNDFESISTSDNRNGVNIENGKVTRVKDGSNFSGEVHIPQADIPASINSAVRALDSDDGVLVGEDGRVTAEVKDGEIVSIKTNKGFKFSKNNQIVGQRKLDAGRKDEGNAPFGGNPKPDNKPTTNYKEIKTIKGVKWGMKADGTIEKIG